MHTMSSLGAALCFFPMSFALGCGGVAVEPSGGSVDAGSASGGARSDAGPETIDARDPRAASIVIAIDERSFVVLDAAPSADWAASGATSLVDVPGWLIAERRADLALLPDDVRARAGEPWRLVAGDGSRCSATLDAPILLRRAEGFVFDESEDDAPAPTRPEDSSLWQDGLELLVAEARSFDGDCEGALFAHTIDHAPARVFRPMSGPISPDLEASARASFEALPAYRAIAAEYAAHVASAEDWEDRELAAEWRAYDGADSLEVRTLRAAEGPERVLVIATAGYGCGGFVESLYALYEPTPTGLVLRDAGTASDAPTMIVELAGGPIVHAAAQRLRYVGVEPLAATEWLDLSAPFFGCPC